MGSTFEGGAFVFLVGILFLIDILYSEFSIPVFGVHPWEGLVISSVWAPGSVADPPDTVCDQRPTRTSATLPRRTHPGAPFSPQSH